MVKLYTKDNKSTLEIAKELKLSISTVRRTLIKNGVELRDKQTAQSLAIKEGRAEHPTKGKERSEDTRQKIAKGQHEVWKSMPDEERERRSQMSQEQYSKLSLVERDEMQERRHAGVRRAAKEGSKMEKFVKGFLLNAGFSVQYHRANFLPNINLEVDLLVPELKTAIEIDGPSHFLPIWGELALRKTIDADAQKAGLLLSVGYVLIRVKCLNKNISNFLLEETGKQIVEKLNQIKAKFPDKNNRFIEIEIK